MKIDFRVIEINTQSGINLHDITPQIRQAINECQLRAGFIVVSSRHTTTAITINENESRLLRDIPVFLEKLVPQDAPYLHNDISLRDCPPDEPQNAHSHIAAMLLGSSESIPVVNGKLAIGQWQSIMLIELDGPRARTVNLQLIGE